MSTEPLLSVRDLTVTFADTKAGGRPLTAVRGVDLDIPEGNILFFYNIPPLNFSFFFL